MIMILTSVSAVNFVTGATTGACEYKFKELLNGVTLAVVAAVDCYACVCSLLPLPFGAPGGVENAEVNCSC